MTEFLDAEALRRLGMTPILFNHLLAGPPATSDASRPMRLVEIQRDHVLLHDGRQLHAARPSHGLATHLDQQEDALAVGDWVLARARPAGQQHALVDELLPRRNALARRTHDGRGGLKRQVLVSNVDTALVVMGLDHDFNLRRLERYLALVQVAGVQPVLLLTKADTVTAAECERSLAQARAVLPTATLALAVDGRAPQQLQLLAPWLDCGQTLVLLGSSGAGKSTLTNTLSQTGEAADQARTGAVRGDDSRGRHTTTARSLRCIPAGACIIDTPGLRALRLDIEDSDALAQSFADVASLSAACRFRNCQHLDEPGCAVREAVAPERLRNFQKLLREAARDGLGVLQRRQRLAQWKSRSRAVRQRQQR